MPKLMPEPRRPRAIRDLSVLPVFYDLSGKPVLVAGNGEGAAWKAELLAAAGAKLRLACESPGPDLDGIIASHPGRIEMLGRDWRATDFDDAVIAVGAFDTASEAEAFATGARNAGVPVNLIDRKELCDFQFGSIVNRSPVVVSVSTSGAAPALGQAIRTRIESLLPEALSGWAAAAKTARAKLARRLPVASARKAFWRRFAEAAFTGDASKAAPMLERAGEPSARRGHVTLVGAGPGAADLLTVRAVRAMQAADIILFDALVSEDVLDLARREAKRMLVGKRGNRASCKQEDINALMISLARQGKRVVRLKSGDPMIFGRAGEEIEALEAEDIPVDVVPGVTAALAAASSLGVSLTHRDCAQGVKFVTAHSRKGCLPELDWRACADPATTLVVYMGGRTANSLARRLISEGLDAETPAVIMKEVSSAGESRIVTSLRALETTEVEVNGPVLIGIGKTFARATRVANCPNAGQTACDDTAMSGTAQNAFELAVQQS